MASAKISIILPVYNPTKYLFETLKSIKAQSYKNYELIIVDDCSCNDVISLVKQIECKNVKYLRHRRNRGVAAARNTGIKKAHGKYVTFIDGDDVWCEDKLKEQVSFMDRNGHVGLLYGDNYRFDNKGLQALTSMQLKKYYRGNVYSKLLYMNFIPLLTVMVRKNIVDKYRFNEGLRFAEDYDLWLRIAENNYVDYIPRIVAGYRFHEGQVIQRSRLDNIKDEQKVLLNQWELYGKKYEYLRWIIVKRLLRLHLQTFKMRYNKYKDILIDTQKMVLCLLDKGLIKL